MDSGQLDEFLGVLRMGDSNTMSEDRAAWQWAGAWVQERGTYRSRSIAACPSRVE